LAIFGDENTMPRYFHKGEKVKIETRAILTAENSSVGRLRL